MTRGIVNPWKKPPAPTATEDGRRPDGVRYEHEVPIAGAAPTRVVFAGRAYALYVDALPRKGVEPEAVARAVMGGFLAELLALRPRGPAALETQGLGTARPLGPAIGLDFGGLTLYAKASSTDAELATKMAYDRLALALSELRVTEPVAKRVFETYPVSIARKT